MGYACPVCEDPQADGEHLANHLAFAAMLHDDDHAEFLDAHVADWENRKPPELAAEVIHHASYVEHDVVFDDTTSAEPGAGAVDRPAPQRGLDAEAPPVDLDGIDEGTLDEESQRVIDEARKLFSRDQSADEDED